MIILYTKQGAELLKIEVDSSSYAYREIMGETRLVLYFALATYVEIPTGAFCNFEGNRYELMFPTSVKIQHRRDYEYTLEMRSSDAVLAYYKFREVTYSSNTDTYGGSRRLKFSLTATPAEHLAMVVANLNERTDGGWTAGECIASSEKVVTYCHASVLDALKQIAESFDTEYEIVNKTVSLKKVEYYKGSPLVLEYGKGKGLKSGIQRTNQDSQGAVGVLFVEGSDRNIDSTKYDGARELHLPKNGTLGYDGEKFSNESGYISSSARVYQADSDGWSLVRIMPSPTCGIEESIDLTDIFPTKEHTILRVIVVDADKHWYDIVIDAPEDLDYRDCQIKGEAATVAFQDKMLAGKEFDIQTTENGNLSISKYYENNIFIGWRVPLKPETIDDMEMPGGNFIPEANGKVKIFGVSLPSQYIRHDTDKSGAEWDLFREAVKYMYENEEQKFTLKAEIDGIWAKTNWNSVGQYMKCGAYIRFVDPSIQADGRLIRITGIKTYVNNPKSPEVTLSNESIRPSIAAALKEIDNSKYESEQLYRKSVDFSKRRFRDAVETMGMIEDAFVNDIQKYTSGIRPAFVQTMQTLIGDESLQFRWVTSYSNLNPPATPWAVTVGTSYLTIPSGYLQHMTLGVSDLTVAERSAGDYMIWHLNARSIALNSLDAEKAYYLYAKVSKTSQTGTSFVESPTSIGMESVAGYYHLLIGILNSEADGTRAFAPMYGFTEILPGRITAEKIFANWLNLAEGAKIGDWTHSAGKIQSEEGEIVLDAQNELIEIGRRLRLTPNLLQFLKTAGGSDASLIINADAVGNWESIPVVLNEHDAVWTCQYLDAFTFAAGAHSSNDISFSHSLLLGQINSGTVIIKAGTGYSVYLSNAAYYAEFDNVYYGYVARGIVTAKLLRDGAVVATSNSISTDFVGSESTLQGYTTSPVSFSITTPGVYSITIDITLGAQTQETIGGEANAFLRINSRIQYDAVSQGEENTLLAPDGLRSVWGDGYLFLDKDTFVVRKGTHLLSISTEGNRFSNDGGETWQDIGSSGNSEENSITVDSSLSASSQNPVRNSTIYAALQGKQNSITGAASTITEADLTSGRVLITNSSGKVAVSSITATIIGYLSGLTSNVQTQINGKATLAELQEIFLRTENLEQEIETLGILDDKQDLLVSGTNIKTVNGQSLLGAGDIVIQSGGGSSIGPLTALRVLISDTQGQVAVSQLSENILNYLTGITGNVQTQINNKADKSSLSSYVLEQALGDMRYAVSGLYNDAGYLTDETAHSAGFIKLADLDGAELSLLNIEVGEDIIINGEYVVTENWVENKGYATVTALSVKQDKMGSVVNNDEIPSVDLAWNNVYHIAGYEGDVDSITLNAPSYTTDLSAEIIVRITVGQHIPELIFESFDYLMWANGTELYPDEANCVYEYSIAPYEDGVLIVGAKFK